LKQALRKIHRYLGLTLSLWAVQALSGMLMVFHWELDDAFIPGEHRAMHSSRECLHRRVLLHRGQGIK
jgi:uncharacterized iron-regulated membrane protein